MLAVPTPILPQITPTRPTIPTGGTEITVGSGKDYPGTSTGLQDALNAATRGDIITIDAGTNITVGNTPIYMPIKAGSGYVWIRSSGHASFTDDIRAGSGDTGSMATLTKTTMTNWLLEADYNKVAGQMAHSYVWEGIEFTTSHSSGTVNIIVTTGRCVAEGYCDDQSYEPHDIYFLHCYIHGDNTNYVLDGWEAGGYMVGMWDSTVDQIVSTAEAHGIHSSSGTGGVIVDNCKVQATGIPILWGGGVQQMSNINMADITVRRCDLSWDPAWGTAYLGKNGYEIKHGDRHLLENCTIHDILFDQQAGHAIVVKDDAYGDTWNRVRDVTIRNCKVYNAAAFISLLTIQGDNQVDVHYGLSDVLIRNCVAWNLNPQHAGGGNYAGTFIDCTPSNAASGQVMRRIQAVHNTVVADDFGGTTASNILALKWSLKNNSSGDWYDHFYCRDNVFSLWGANKAGTAGFATVDPTLYQQSNQQAIETSVPNYDVRGNLMIGGYTESRFPSGNTKATDYAAVQFEDWANGDLRLAAGSPGKGQAVYGGDPGANIPSVDSATAGCLTGDWI